MKKIILLALLSVGGLAGYQRAMRTYKMNEVINAIREAWIQAESRARTNPPNEPGVSVPCSDFVDYSFSGSCSCSLETTGHATCETFVPDMTEEICGRLSKCSDAKNACIDDADMFFGGGNVDLRISHRGWESTGGVPLDEFCD